VRRAVAIALALLVQAALLAAVAAPRLWPRLTGDEYRLEVAPVDPIDPFRGAYVALRVRGVPAFTRSEGTVYIELRRQRDGRYRGSGTRTQKPAAGPFLRCNADGEVRCGIESFFASQARARRIERELADGATARVRIDGAGRAALVDLETR
jgi:uncharacterized membrane-anchored protein